MNISELKGKYSLMESLIFEALRRQKHATNESLLREVYPSVSDQPFHAMKVVNGAITNLGKKLQSNKEAFRLERKRIPHQSTIENRIIKRNSK